MVTKMKRLYFFNFWKKNKENIALLGKTVYLSLKAKSLKKAV